MNHQPTSSLPAALAMFNLTGRVALVTGGASGIGRGERGAEATGDEASDGLSRSLWQRLLAWRPWGDQDAALTYDPPARLKVMRGAVETCRLIPVMVTFAIGAGMLAGLQLLVLTGGYGLAAIGGGVLMLAQSSDPALGGDDVIEAGSGNNVVLAGFGADRVRGGGAERATACGLFGDAIYRQPRLCVLACGCGRAGRRGTAPHRW